LSNMNADTNSDVRADVGYRDKKVKVKPEEDFLLCSDGSFPSARRSCFFSWSSNTTSSSTLDFSALLALSSLTLDAFSITDRIQEMTTLLTKAITHDFTVFM